jgi:hypothetical protein
VPNNLNGKIILLKRRGEEVEGKLLKSEYGSHYNAEWVNSDGQIFIGKVEDWELKNINNEKNKKS